MAPPAAGKSTFVERNPGRAIDGDHVVKTCLGWPPGEWWRRDDAKTLHEENWAVVCAASQLLARPVLFVGEPTLSSRCLILKVLPPIDQTMRRNAAREALHPRGLTDADIAHSYESLERIPGEEFASFEEALSRAEQEMAASVRSSTIVAALDGPDLVHGLADLGVGPQEAVLRRLPLGAEVLTFENGVPARGSVASLLSASGSPVPGHLREFMEVR